jgi:hypothetical protein
MFVPALALALFALPAFAQTSKKPVKKTPRPVPTAQSTPQPEATPEPSRTPSKKNDRPVAANSDADRPAAYKPTYFYEFSQPNFIVSKISIEHDDTGAGRISIRKQDWSEPDSDPIRISDAALARIRAAYDALDFLNSGADYQYEKDYPHLGSHTFRLVRNGKEREAVFNWTEVKDAKALMNEYRKVGNQFIWIFDMNVARISQPLDAPKQMDAVDSLFRRGELSDPVQLIPYLKEVSLDERIPLIARNHAARLIERILKDE